MVHYARNAIIFNFIFLVFLFLSFTLPIRRPVMTDALDSYGLDTFFNLMPFISIFAMILIYYQMRYVKELGRVFGFLDKVFKTENLHLVGSLLLPVMMIMFILKVPGGWWTWSTLGVHVGTTIIIATLLRNRLPAFSALLAGGSITCIGVGVWEVVYQVGLYIEYYRPQGAGYGGIVFTVLFVAPFVVGGIGTIIMLSGRPFHIRPYWNLMSFYTLVLCVVALATWYFTGFWQDVIYDFEREIQVFTPNVDYVGMIFYRLSKVWLALFLITLYVPGTRQNG